MQIEINVRETTVERINTPLVVPGIGHVVRNIHCSQKIQPLVASRIQGGGIIYTD